MQIIFKGVLIFKVNITDWFSVTLEAPSTSRCGHKQIVLIHFKKLRDGYRYFGIFGKLTNQKTVLVFTFFYF